MTTPAMVVDMVVEEVDMPTPQVKMRVVEEEKVEPLPLVVVLPGDPKMAVLTLLVPLVQLEDLVLVVPEE